MIAPRSDEGLIEQFEVYGTTCQVAHIPVAQFEAEIRRVAVEHDLDPLLFKSVGGLHEGLPLHGAERIERWRNDARYTDELQRAVVVGHWRTRGSGG